MRIVKTQPTEGQFITVWVYNDLLWADSCLINEAGVLETYSGAENSDCFIIPEGDIPPEGITDHWYIINE